MKAAAAMREFLGLQIRFMVSTRTKQTPEFTVVHRSPVAVGIKNEII